MSVRFLSEKDFDGLTTAYLVLRPHERGDDVKRMLYDANLFAFKQRYPYADVLPFESFEPVPLPTDSQVVQAAGCFVYQIASAYHRPDATEDVVQAMTLCATVQYEFAVRALAAGGASGETVWTWP